MGDDHEFAMDLHRIIKSTADAVAGAGSSNELVEKVTTHLGIPLSQVVLVGRDGPQWEHASVQAGVDAYLEKHGAGEWFGIVGGQRVHEELISMLVQARRSGTFELGAVDYATVATGPDDATEVIQLGLVPATAAGGTPVIIGIRGANAMFGQEVCRLEVLAGAREVAAAVREEIERLMGTHNVLRGQVLSFGTNEHRGNELLSFMPRPQLSDDEVILPEGVLEAIERHTVGIDAHGERLLAAGQHLKRGLLLHGPAGTGKTHTVRYLLGRLPESTVIVLTGMAMRWIAKAAELARRLQPSVVVLEDVDLIAQERSYGPVGANPLLFMLLDAMDGIGRDANVTFVLTTNRADELERALTDRPGRVDLAVEIPKPDADGRLRLLELYGRGIELTADLAPIVESTEGVTASYIKELLRRAVLKAIAADPGGDAVTVDSETLTAALAEMQGDHNALTRALLGAGEAQPRSFPG
ncbi:AAA family ATPase [Amycolatopsis sp. NPDC059657]|uniref:AAA family ATPase n=1 Tax=Amycolatopsis sp. NPDC059657 TaxID=3346899 RepID=UPI003672A11D